MKFKKHYFSFLFFFFIGFFISYNLHPYYLYGDQLFYRNFYEQINWYEGVEAFAFYKNTVGATEPLYLYLTKFLSFFFEKDFIYSIINGVFLGVVSLNLLKRKFNFFLIFIFIFNFYLMTLFFSAERLKLAVLCMGIFFLIHGNLKFLFLLMAPLFQMQMIIPIISWLIWHFWGNLRLIKFYYILIAALVFFAGYYFLHDYLNIYLQDKSNSYQDAGWGGPVALIKPFLFMSIAFIVVENKEKLKFFISMVPILVAAYYFGAERQTFICYAIMIYYWASVWRGFNIPIIVSGVYFFIQGVFFVDDFIKSGFSGG